METTDLVDGASHRRILIVENQPLVRLGMVGLIGAESGLVVCGETGSAVEAPHLIEHLRPDLVVTALSMRDGDGFELIRDIRAAHERLPILVYSLRDETLAAPRALNAGATGYVGKWEAHGELMAAIHTVLGGEIWLSPKMRMQPLPQLQ